MMVEGMAWVLGLLLAGAPSAAALRDEAARDYRAKRYTEACPKFQRAAELAPADSAILADLGLCLEKLGKREEATAATRRAIALGDKKTRLNAYYNLGKMGVQVSMPAPGACDVLKVDGCAEQFYACTYPWELAGSGGGAKGTAVRVSTVQSEAQDAFQLNSLTFDPRTSFDDDIKKGERVDVSLDLRLIATDWASCPCTDKTSEEKKRCGLDCKPQESHSRCMVVHVNPCSHLMGIYCESVGSDRRRKTLKDSVAGEVRLERPRG